MNSMSSSTDKCKQLRKLYDRLADELRVLKENVQEEEQEGFENPIETVNIIKSLQKALSTVDLELQKCPDTD
jgi:flagellin-specific chaperone FliS